MQFASRHEVMQGGSRDALGSHPCQVPGLDYADGARLLPTTNPEDPYFLRQGLRKALVVK